jgi:hypothetical protein
LHLKWQDYLGLFGTTEDHVQLLNATAPTFTFHLQKGWRQDCPSESVPLTLRFTERGPFN